MLISKPLSTEVLEILNTVEGEYCTTTQYSLALALLARIAANIVERGNKAESINKRVITVCRAIVSGAELDLRDQVTRQLYSEEES